MHRRIRWGRVLAAALLSELGVIAVLVAISTVYMFFIAPGRTSAEYQAFAARAGYYVAPAVSGLATFLAVLWLWRRFDAHPLANGAAVGIAAAILASSFLFTARPEDRAMYVVSFALRIAGGCLGGAALQTAHRRKSAVPPSDAAEAMIR